MKNKTSLFLAGGLLLSVATANAETITKPHTFSAGTPAQADQVNADFDTVYDQVNKVGAAINVDQPTGNIGIGKAPSASKLDVNGAISASGTLNIATSGTQKGIIATTSGTEAAAQFSQTNAASAQAAVSASHSGSGAAVDARNSGTGKGGSYEIMAGTNGQPALYGRTRGTGSAGYFVITNPASLSSAIQASSDGHGNVISASSQGPEGSAADFLVSDPANTSPAIFVDTQGGGYAGWFNKKVLVNGALDIYGAVSGESFSGNGSGLTNVNAATASAVNWSGIAGVPAALADGDDVNDADADPTNELQTLSLVNSTLALTNGGAVLIDPSDANELNSSVSMSGTLLQVEDGGGTKSLDLAERLSISNLSDAKSDGSSVFIGANSGSNANVYTYNTGLGVSALASTMSGHRNTAVGAEALYANTGGAYNTATGLLALRYNTMGESNTAAGAFSLYYNSTGTNNVGIGFYANAYNQAGSNNTIIGYQAGQGGLSGPLHSKSGNVFLGYQAGFNELGSDKLYIDNSATATPLIHGDFASNALTVNGTLTVTGKISNGAKSVVLGASQLVYSPSDSAVRDAIGVSTYKTAGSNYSQLPLTQVPDGASITDVDCAVADTSAADRMAFALHQCGFADGGCSVMVNWCYSGSAGGCLDGVWSGGMATLNPEVIPFTVDRDNYFYNIVLWQGNPTSGSSVAFYSCKVTYE